MNLHDLHPTKCNSVSMVYLQSFVRYKHLYKFNKQTVILEYPSLFSLYDIIELLLCFIKKKKKKGIMIHKYNAFVEDY